MKTDEDDEFDRIERENQMKGQPYHFAPKDEPVAWIWEKEDGYTSIETHALDDDYIQSIIIHFATLVAQQEREACAKIADTAEPYKSADLIRARGQA
jgi:hypothetical protein